MEWVFPLDVGSLTGQQVQPLSDALDQLGTHGPTLSGNLAPVAPALTASSNMLSALKQFIATAQSVDALLWLLYVSLTVAGPGGAAAGRADGRDAQVEPRSR